MCLILTSISEPVASIHYSKSSFFWDNYLWIIPVASEYVNSKVMMHEFSKWTFSRLGEQGDNHSALCIHTWGSHCKYHDSPPTPPTQWSWWSENWVNCQLQLQNFCGHTAVQNIFTLILGPNNFTKISLILVCGNHGTYWLLIHYS